MDKKTKGSIVIGMLGLVVLGFIVGAMKTPFSHLSFLPQLPPAHNEVVTYHGVYSTGDSAP